MAFTLIDRETNRAIRVRLKDGFFENILKSPFVELRKEGVLPQDIKGEVTDPLFDNVLKMPEENFIEIGEIFPLELPKGKGSFETEICADCGERVFSNAVKKTEKGNVCLNCAK
jgi:formylmethanofuran dehydrogenase subunit E